MEPKKSTKKNSKVKTLNVWLYLGVMQLAATSTFAQGSLSEVDNQAVLESQSFLSPQALPANEVEPVIQAPKTTTSSSTGSSSTVPVASHNDKKAITQLFANYMDRYNHYLQTQNLKASPRLYNDAITVMSSRGTASQLPLATFNQQIPLFLEGLSKKGVHKVNWREVNVQLLDDKLAMASNVAVRYTKTGDIVNEVGATYMLNKLDGEWRISTFAVHSPINVVQF